MEIVEVYSLDIETMPIPGMESQLPEPEVKYGNTKDEFKRAQKRQEAIKKQINDMALSPMCGKICCACAYGNGFELINCSLDEESIIESIFENVLSFNNQIVTWNGINFDVPFIYKRALFLGIKPPVSMDVWMKRYSYNPHCDLMQAWCGWGNKYTGLDKVSKALLDRGKTEIDFKQFPELMETEEGRDNIGEYCLEDCKLTFEVFEKCNNVLF